MVHARLFGFAIVKKESTAKKKGCTAKKKAPSSQSRNVWITGEEVGKA